MYVKYISRIKSIYTPRFENKKQLVLTNMRTPEKQTARFPNISRRTDGMGVDILYNVARYS